MEDTMMENTTMEDLNEEDPEKEVSETQDPDQENPAPEEPGPEVPDKPKITLDETVRRFGALLALTTEEAEAERELCAAALDRMKDERNRLPGGEGPLMDYAAALAGHRYILRCLARGLTVTIGDPTSGPAGARAAAEALVDDYRAAASRWLRPRGFYFRRTAGTGRRLWKR